MTIDVGKEFSKRLSSRNEAIKFRNKYLKNLCNHSQWSNYNEFICLDFSNVVVMSPGFANEAFGYFTNYATPSQILIKIKIIHISKVKMDTLSVELNSCYYQIKSLNDDSNR